MHLCMQGPPPGRQFCDKLPPRWWALHTKMRVAPNLCMLMPVQLLAMWCRMRGCQTVILTQGKQSGYVVPLAKHGVNEERRGGRAKKTWKKLKRCVYTHQSPNRSTCSQGCVAHARHGGWFGVSQRNAGRCFAVCDIQSLNIHHVAQSARKATTTITCT